MCGQEAGEKKSLAQNSYMRENIIIVMITLLKRNYLPRRTLQALGMTRNSIGGVWHLQAQFIVKLYTHDTNPI